MKNVDIVFVTNLPSFYKIELYTLIPQHILLEINLKY